MGTIVYAEGHELKCPVCKNKYFSLKVIIGFGEICEYCFKEKGGSKYFEDYKRALEELNE